MPFIHNVYWVSYLFIYAHYNKLRKQMRQTKKRVTPKEKLLTALEETYGVVTEACKKAGISRAQFYRYMDSDDNFKQEVYNIQDSAIDFVESQLFKNMKEGNVTAQIFYLKTKGKHRGYVERQEIQQETTASIKFDFN